MAARNLWINRRSKFFNKALPRLVFLDETSTNTKLTKRTGWAPRGKRYRSHAPFGTHCPAGDAKHRWEGEDADLYCCSQVPQPDSTLDCGCANE
jgi:hypothetical protein